MTMENKGTLAYEWNGTPPTPLESVAITLQMWKLNPPGSTETYATVDVANSTEIRLKASTVKGTIPLDECPPELLYAITPIDQRSSLPQPVSSTDDGTTTTATVDDPVNSGSSSNGWQMRVLVRSWDDAYSRVDVSLALDTLLALPTTPFTLFGGNLALSFHSASSSTSKSSSSTSNRKPPPPRSQQRKSPSTTTAVSSSSPEKKSSSPSPSRNDEGSPSSPSHHEYEDEENEEDDRWDRSPTASPSSSTVRSPSSTSPASSRAVGDNDDDENESDQQNRRTSSSRSSSSPSSPSVVRKILPESTDSSDNDEATHPETTTPTHATSPAESYQYQQRLRSLKEEIKTFEQKLATLKANTAELDKRGAGILDMEARANREIKARKAAEARRTEAETEVEKLKNELKVLEGSRMVADRTATENAEVAIAWKERSEGWETAYEALKKEHDTLTEKYQQLESTVTVTGTLTEKDNTPTASTANSANGSPLQRPRSPLTTNHPSPLSIPRTASTPPSSSSGISSGRNSPVPMPPSLGGSNGNGVSTSANDPANMNATANALHELQERHNVRIKELENQITLLRTECDNLRNQTVKENNRIRSYRQALSAARTCLASYASVIERGCIDVENQIGSLMNYTFPREEVRSAIVTLHNPGTASSSSNEENDTDLVNEPMLHSTGHAALAKHGQTAIGIALKAVDENRKAGYENGTKASESKLTELRKTHETLLEERSKLVRDWEQYASHWETRGREAERLNTEWEKSFDTQQQQLVSIVKERDDIRNENDTLRNDLAQLRTLSETAINESVALRDYLTALGHGAAVSTLSRGLAKLSSAILSSSSIAINSNSNNGTTVSSNTGGSNTVNSNHGNGSNRNLGSSTGTSSNGTSTINYVSSPNNSSSLSSSTTAVTNINRPIPHIPPTVPLSIPPITMTTNNVNNSTATASSAVVLPNTPETSPPHTNSARSLTTTTNNLYGISSTTLNNNNNSGTINNEILNNNPLNYYQNLASSVSGIYPPTSSSQGLSFPSSSSPASMVNSVTINGNNKNISLYNYGNSSSSASSLGMTTNSANLSPVLASLPLSSNGTNVSVAASIRRQTSGNKKTGTGW